MCDDNINHTTVKQDLFFLRIFALDLFQVRILLTLPWRALCGKANVQISQIERLNVFTLPASSYKVHAHLRIKRTHFQGLYWKHLGSAYHVSSRFYPAGNLKSKRVRTHLLLCATYEKDHLWVKFRVSGVNEATSTCAQVFFQTGFFHVSSEKDLRPHQKH